MKPAVPRRTGATSVLTTESEVNVLRNLLVGLVLVSGLLCGLATADSLSATSTGPVKVTVPYTKASPRIFVRGGQGLWQPAQFTQSKGTLTFHLDPGQLGGPTVMLLLDPPAGLNLNDDRAPQLVGLKADGKGLSLASPVDLGTSPTAPKTLLAAFRDVENGIDAASLKVLVDGQLLGGRQLQVQPGPRELRVTAALPALEYGRHEIALSVRDTSPQANLATVRVRLQRLDTTNLALAALGAKVTVDSCFPGYESLVALNDGVTALPGDTCPNELTWASAETDTDHWAEVQLPRPQLLKEVTVFWAAYTDRVYSPQHYAIQVPEGEGWKAVYESPAAGEKPGSPVTTARFCLLKTDRFRVFMPAGQGAAIRPRLLWIAEIQAR